MKIQYQDLINRANKVAEEHHDMDLGSIRRETVELEAKFEVAQEDIWDRENECADDQDAINEARKAINAANDAAEMHHGGGATQI